jgi:hypothetical protein
MRLFCQFYFGDKIPLFPHQVDICKSASSNEGRTDLSNNDSLFYVGNLSISLDGSSFPYMVSVAIQEEELEWEPDFSLREMDAIANVGVITLSIVYQGSVGHQNTFERTYLIEEWPFFLRSKKLFDIVEPVGKRRYSILL